MNDDCFASYDFGFAKSFLVGDGAFDVPILAMITVFRFGYSMNSE